MKKAQKVCVLLFAAVVCAVCVYTYNGPSRKKAEAAAKAYAEAIDYDYKTPEKIYSFMTAEYKSKMSEEEFVKAFNKERSYPYLTPLFINYTSVSLDNGKKTGKAEYSQAARLPGMVYEVGLVYENGGYHIKDFENFPDGSYLKKFDSVSYSLDSYFDFSQSDEKR